MDPPRLHEPEPGEQQLAGPSSASQLAEPAGPDAQARLASQLEAAMHGKTLSVLVEAVAQARDAGLDPALVATAEARARRLRAVAMLRLRLQWDSPLEELQAAVEELRSQREGGEEVRGLAALLVRGEERVQHLAWARSEDELRTGLAAGLAGLDALAGAVRRAEEQGHSSSLVDEARKRHATLTAEACLQARDPAAAYLAIGKMQAVGVDAAEVVLVEHAGPRERRVLPCAGTRARSGERGSLLGRMGAQVPEARRRGSGTECALRAGIRA